MNKKYILNRKILFSILVKMTFLNHIIITNSVGYILDFKKPYQLGIIAFASILPDRLEFLGRIKIIPHRTITHSVIFWFLIFIFSFFYLKNNFPDYLIVWKCFLIGITGHLFEDMLTKTGIPLFFNKPRIALKFFATGSISEYLISFFTIFVIFFSHSSFFQKAIHSIIVNIKNF